MDDIKVRLEYLRTKIGELAGYCSVETGEFVTNDVRNISQDIITGLNRLLDNIVMEFFLSKIKPSLTEKIDKLQKRVQFPIAKNSTDLYSQLCQWGGKNFEVDHPEFFRIIESSQSYISGEVFLDNLKKYSNLGHQKLISQIKSKKEFLVLDGFVIGRGSKIKNCSSNGILIGMVEYCEDGTIKSNGVIDPRLHPRIVIEVEYFLEEGKVNLFELCNKSLNKITEIVNSVGRLI